MNHPDPEIDHLFRLLQAKLCSWERSTGRDSLLIFRESDRNLVQHGPQPSAVCLRLENGVSVDPHNSDLDDARLLERFTDAFYNAAGESYSPSELAPEIRE